MQNNIIKYLVFFFLLIGSLYLLTGCHLGRYIHPNTYHYGWRGSFDQKGNPIFESRNDYKKRMKQQRNAIKRDLK